VCEAIRAFALRIARFPPLLHSAAPDFEPENFWQRQYHFSVYWLSGVPKNP
jgi:hypothetical protein